MQANIPQNSEKQPIPQKNGSAILDTLAQPRKSDKKAGKNTLKRRAVAKFITNEMLYSLVDQDSTLHQSYWNSFHCSESLVQNGKKITGKYCNNRWCIVCNRIRTAKLINGYLPAIKNEIIAPYFVTLTIPNVGGSDLKATIREMIVSFIRIKDVFRHKRSELRGIRKVECTYNARENSFHPHFHMIVDGELAAAELIDRWLKAYPQANRAAQDMRPADEGSMIELFKYTTKLVTKSDIKREDGKAEINIYPEALDVIFKALYKIRTFQAYGGITKVPVSEDIEEIQAELFTDLDALTAEVWNWIQPVSDWVSTDGECLTECEAHKKYKVKKQSTGPDSLAINRKTAFPAGKTYTAGWPEEAGGRPQRREGRKIKQYVKDE